MSTNAIEHCDLVDLAVLGTVVRVRLEDAADRQVVEAAWHLCALPPGPREVPTCRVVTLRASATSETRRFALTGLTQDVTRAAIKTQAGEYLMFHAGALSNPETGAAVVYVAPGGTGKTTISRMLGPGRGYVTDETVAVDRSGLIAAYPKPLSTRIAAGGKEEVPPGALGLRAPATPPWIAGLLTLNRDPEHDGDPERHPVELLDALAVLSPEISSLAALADPLRTCRDVIEAAGGLIRVSYRDASQLEPMVDEILRRVKP